MSKGKRHPVMFVLLFFLTLNPYQFIASCSKTENIWMEVEGMTDLLLQKCIGLGSDGPLEQSMLIALQCLKRRSLAVLDMSLQNDVIEITNDIELVKTFNNATESRQFTPFSGQLIEIETDWKTQVLQRIAHVLETHVLKIRLDGHKGQEAEARGRRKKGMLMSLIVFGIIALGMVMIPMGFKFLTILGGKALLLAILALILTSIQGLKKIATSNVNYGLYSTPPENHYGHCKNELCSVEYNPLEADDSVFVSIDVDDLALSHHDFPTDFAIWPYERQWPYDTEGQGSSPYNYYDVPEQHTDLLHPFHPRVDVYKNKYHA